MKRITHVLFGLIIGAWFLNAYPISDVLEQYVFVILLIIGSALPDIDLLIKSLKHRGITHSIFIPLGLMIAAWLIWFPLIGLSVGYFAHLVLDGLNPMGWKPFQPFWKYTIRGPIKVNSITELLLASILALIIISQIIV